MMSNHHSSKRLFTPVSSQVLCPRVKNLPYYNNLKNCFWKLRPEKKEKRELKMNLEQKKYEKKPNSIPLKAKLL